MSFPNHILVPMYSPSMSQWFYSAIWLLYAGMLGRYTPSPASQHWRLRSTVIDILDDDSVLVIFALCRPALLDANEAASDRQVLQGGEWARERWWYKLAHVCRRWRYLVLGSAAHLGLRLVCTYGTPVADMLAHSPPLPLVLDYIDRDREATLEDETGILAALRHRDRVRRIRLSVPASNFQKLVASMDGEFPTLEHLCLEPQIDADDVLAPLLRHLILVDLAFPIESPLLTTAVGLVTLSLQDIHPSTYFCPNDLLRRLSVMPRHDLERQMLHTPITTQVTLPNLRWLAFKGSSAYLEALFPLITTPVLEKLQLMFFNQLSYPAPRLLEFVSATKSLQFSCARFNFYEAESTKYTLYMGVGCPDIDRQVPSATQIFSELRTAFSSVSYLALEHGTYSTSPERHNEADPTQWRGLLRSFGTCRPSVCTTASSGSSRALCGWGGDGDGEPPLEEPLPELKNLVCPPGVQVGDAFAPFIDARRAAGRPVKLFRH
ncbi:hypothetical protein BC826DRAFT_1034224 [Russula brevipes]|nr:hypothetical protein BC826DRAFT_1034224 [Russula brevipes]